MSTKKRILSAIQPTGDIHFGNYFGAVQNWVRLQEEYICTYGVVDYHAMTMPYEPKKLRQNTWDLIINLVAIGIKPENLFIQSLVPEHTELAWILSCFCSHGELSRMTQFKDKSQQSSTKSDDAFISAGLFGYPVLQAADILIYRADYVPVGKDQEQHLELTRNIAQRFNSRVGKEYFVAPETLFTETPKIMSLADPKKKMSKSLGPKHYVSVFEREADLRNKVKKAQMDSGEHRGTEVMLEGVTNMFAILKACEKTEISAQLRAAYLDGSLSYVDLKNAVTEALLEKVNEFSERKKELMKDKKGLKNQIKASSFEIRKRAQETIKEVKELTGIMNVRF
ncbi:MAG: tryptophan--tRNA ligase [Saprospiraceae bacterium]|nr:tryptophan--tRNA ligase [Saprospiraceae bacterium]